MPKASQLILMVVSLVAFTRPTVALAGPVADADLRGKTICWSYGGTRNTYGKDGSLDSNLVGHGTWSLVGDRITEHGDHGVFSFTIEKQAGTLLYVWEESRRRLGGRHRKLLQMSLPDLVRAGESATCDDVLSHDRRELSGLAHCAARLRRSPDNRQGGNV